ncbi:MAG: glutamate racemase [Gammaproteobacteria bacterium]|nr:glutamate racemase [Gammaproteobacteria bacterium]
MALLIFDSGFGGLSIQQAMKQRYPELLIHQFADHAHLPYGTKSPSFISHRLTTVVPQLIQKLEIDTVVVACNTASTHALSELRQRVRQPVIGVVPAIKPAAQLTHCNHIVVLATTATVNSTYTQQLIDDHASSIKVTLVAADGLVSFAEEKIVLGHIDTTQLSKYVAELIAGISEFDTMVLACTHFPLLKEELSAFLPNHIRLIDSGDAVARRLSDVAPSQSSRVAPATFISSAPLSLTTHDAIKRFGFDQVELL